ncbi:hypothetical protein PV10_04178 [Exophiala mesophila]|uniref:ADF-H domain-containing protein n=1 Tax=Exophiala mesophila TaxID=212818 RepID=A0A0D1WUI8_EXOME|nr:uncharacterized protein PV10_04178 [Exophiala mesophila]KIV92920.1 hypothetical protein PV10_04178 [Exophiala mesophila]
MSLNGLDAAAVAEAHQATLAEAGGWYLLRYTNRDTVELLKRGSGGVQDVRGVIQQYEEKSPLYGLVQYRRKKIILKYVPDGTSRLLQVRLTVQFNTVLETLVPHDTVFSFTNASELTESALGMCTMLLASAGSLTSSSSSLRKRRLDGISEAVEETGSLQADHDDHPAKVKEVSVIESQEPEVRVYGRRELDELPASAVLAKALLAKRKEAAADAEAANLNDTDLVAPAVNGPNTLAVPDPTAQPLRLEGLNGRGQPSPLPVPVSQNLPATPDSTPPTTSYGEAPRPLDYETTNNILLESSAVDHTESLPDTLPHTRHLSAAESDSITQWSSNVASLTSHTTKKKLGPRPHIEPSHRPKTAGTSKSSVNVRPVANLPDSIRVSNRSVVSLSLMRPTSRQSTRSVPSRFPPSSHTINAHPPLPSVPHLIPLYKTTESRPAASRPGSVATEASATATPEKLRLMKALQLRKRNMLMAQRASALPHLPTGSIQASTHSEPPPAFPSPATFPSTLPNHDLLSNIDEESKVAQSSSATSPTLMTNPSEDHSTKASSITDTDDISRKRRSLSSATSSSVTPKADLHHVQPTPKTPDLIPSGTATAVVPHAELVGLNQEPSSNIEEHKEPPIKTLETIKDESPRIPSSQQLLPLARTPRERSPHLSAPFAVSPARSRRPPALQPLKLSSSHELLGVSDASEDEALMDELQYATVHEATPVSVARSPVTPVLSKGSSDRLREIVNKTANSSLYARRSASTTPDRNRPGSVRSTSTALPQWPPVQAETAPVPLTKKPTLGSGISKRIRALEVLTTKDTNVSTPVPPREPSQPKSGFSTFLKRSSLSSNQPAPNASTDISPPKRLPEAVSQYEGSVSGSTRGRRPNLDEAQTSVHKGESISVTARIVRDPNKKHPPMSPSSSYAAPLQLFRSPLIVEHDNGMNKMSQEQSMASLGSVTKSPTKSERGRFSFSSHRSTSQTNLLRSESSHSKISHGNNPRKSAARSLSDTASLNDEKKSSRTSRLMKRVSNLASARKQNQSSPKEMMQANTIQEQKEPDRRNSVSESLLQVVDIGDVNVQFPDSLLWKRRFMRVDDQGYLIFSPPVTDANMKSISRKYHLSDFRKPALPDAEREEIAWSIILDLKDGRCVQCACENRQAQRQVLQLLVDAHSAYHQLYGNS